MLRGILSPTKKYSIGFVSLVKHKARRNSLACLSSKTASSTMTGLVTTAPMASNLQAAANRQLNMHVYSSHLFKLLVTHFASVQRNAASHACLAALHETASEELIFYLDSREVNVAMAMPDYDMFCSDLIIHNMPHNRDEKLVMMDVVRYHQRTCLALRALKCTSQVMRDESLNMFLVGKMASVDKNLERVFSSLRQDNPDIKARLRMPELQPF